MNVFCLWKLSYIYSSLNVHHSTGLRTSHIRNISLGSQSPCPSFTWRWSCLRMNHFCRLGQQNKNFSGSHYTEFPRASPLGEYTRSLKIAATVKHNTNWGPATICRPSVYCCSTCLWGLQNIVAKNIIWNCSIHTGLYEILIFNDVPTKRAELKDSVG